MTKDNVCIECIKSKKTENGEPLYKGTPLPTLSYAKYAREGNRIYRGTQRLNIMKTNTPIYIHIPKTAGRYLLSTIKEKDLDVNFSSHSPAKFIKELVPSYDNEFSFAVVRNPYERFYSACKYNNITDPIQIENLSNKMFSDINWISEFSLFHFEHFFTQKHFVVGNDGETCIVSYVGRYEDLPALIQELKLHGVDIEAEFVQEEDTSSNWESVLTPQTIANISNIYAEDFEYFNYPLI